jgi:hypothetical protein
MASTKLKPSVPAQVGAGLVRSTHSCVSPIQLPQNTRRWKTDNDKISPHWKYFVPVFLVKHFVRLF